MSGASKALTGCGGCGCLLGVLSLLAGVVMAGWGMTDSKVTELVMPGYGSLVGGVIFGLIGAVLLGVSMMMGKKKGDDD
jgi:hypothetical protein